MEANDNADVVTPFRGTDGEYTDFRVYLADCLRNGSATKRGIVIWVDEDGGICPKYGGVTCSNMALAAAHLLKDCTDET